MEVANLKRVPAMTHADRSKQRKVLRRLAALGLSLVVLAGCGGASTLTKEQYAAKVSSGCTNFARGERAIGEPHSVADVAARGPRIAALFAVTLERPLARLRPPPAFASLHTRLVGLARRQHEVRAALARAARHSDLTSFTRLVAENERVNRAAAAVARQVGAAACAGP